MKILYVLALALSLTTCAHAGTSGCQSAAIQTAPGDYSAADPLCVVQAQVSDADFGFVRYTLPDSPYLGQEFTIQENSAARTDSGSYYDDDLQQWVDYSYSFTGGIAIHVASTSSAQITFSDDPDSPYQEVTDFSKGQYLKVVFDGTSWVCSIGTI